MTPTALESIIAISKVRPFSFFPLLRYSKKPYHRFLWDRFKYDRPTDSDVALWRTECPSCNIAIVTGAISDIVVVDCDSDAATRTFLDVYAPANTITVITARGTHFYFTHPKIRITNTVNLPILRKTDAPSGIDIRADGGYVVAPGSIHHTGFIYMWGHSPYETTAAQLPPAILSQLKSSERNQPVGGGIVGGGYALGALRSEVERIRRLPRVEGSGKNAALNRAAFRMGQLIGVDLLDEDVVVDALIGAWLSLEKPEREGRATIASGIRGGKLQPRSGGGVDPSRSSHCNAVNVEPRG